MIIGIIILAEVALAIYVFAFKSKFEDDFIPKLQDTVRTTYEGPLGLIGNSNQSKPSAASLAWDFVMYNVGDRCSIGRSHASSSLLVSMLWCEKSGGFQCNSEMESNESLVGDAHAGRPEIFRLSVDMLQVSQCVHEELE